MFLSIYHLVEPITSLCSCRSIISWSLSQACVHVDLSSRGAYHKPVFLSIYRRVEPISNCVPVDLSSCGAYHKPVFLSICRRVEPISSCVPVDLSSRGAYLKLCSCRSVVPWSLSQACVPVDLSSCGAYHKPVFLSIYHLVEPITSLCSCRSVVPWSLSQAAREGAIKLSRCRSTFAPAVSLIRRQPTISTVSYTALSHPTHSVSVFLPLHFNQSVRQPTAGHMAYVLQVW